MEFTKGQKVFWKWMGKEIFGEIVESYDYPISKEIKGKIIKRNGSVEKPAYLVKSEAGNFALKLETEIFKENREKVFKELDKKLKL